MHRKRGFTLIELLVVVSIIGILATLVITQLGNARVKARNSSIKSDVVEGGKAVEIFKNDDTASERVIGAAINNAGNIAGASLVLTGTVGRLPDVFTGTLDPAVGGANGLEYPVKFVKTPSGSTTYRYCPTSARSTIANFAVDANGVSNYRFTGNNIVGEALGVAYTADQTGVSQGADPGATGCSP